MTILIMADDMQITVENNKHLTRITRLLDCTSLLWCILNDTSILVEGKKELLYELLLELTKIYLGKIEII